MSRMPSRALDLLLHAIGRSRNPKFPNIFLWSGSCNCLTDKLLVTLFSFKKITALVGNNLIESIYLHKEYEKHNVEIHSESIGHSFLG